MEGVEMKQKHEIYEILHKVGQSCIDEIIKEVDSNCENVHYRTIAIIRTYNRKFKKEMRAKLPDVCVKDDGFSKHMKRMLLECGPSKELKAALKYI